VKSRKTNTFLCLFLVIVCILFAAFAEQQNERITELETERDIYQSRAEAAETSLNAKRKITLPE
jgi:Tfp pilus assembly protein PilX